MDNSGMDVTFDGKPAVIGIMGAGRVGTAIGAALYRSGHPVSGVVSRTLESATRAATAIGSGMPSQDPRDALHGADIVFLTVSDDAIALVVDQFADALAVSKVQLIIHTSGALGAHILSTPKTEHILTLSMHPFQTIPDRKGSSEHLQGIRWGLEGSDQALEYGKRLVRTMGGFPMVIEEGKKALYHAAAVMSSNYATALLHMSSVLMAAAGIPRDESVEALQTMMLAAVRHAGETGLPGALTGPIERGDVHTIVSHLNALEGHGEIGRLYRLLGLYTLNMALEKHGLSELTALAADTGDGKNRAFTEIKDVLSGKKP